jgi:ATP-dependent Lhr-like helicase
VVVLADPPSSVSAFLQRIGRGNRRSDRCVVWGCAPDDWAATLFPALKRCAQLGQLDDVHEYGRPSVDFQQIISAAWIGLRQHRALTRANLDDRTGGSVDQSVLDDMLDTGALKEAGATLLPSDEWCDIGDERRIHSVIVGNPGLPLVDVHSGEIIGNGAAIGTGGLLFAGGGFRSIQGADEQGVYVGGVSQASRGDLVRLPSTRGRIRGLSRQIVAAIAENQGNDPRRWQRDPEYLITWGGYPYNFLLKGILVASGHPKKLSVDAFGLNDLDPAFDITPEKVLSMAAEVLDNSRLPRTIAERFREGTQFFRNLSPALQLQEARRAVPREGFMNWVRSCRL